MLNFLSRLVDRYLNASFAFFLCMALTLGATYYAFRSSKLENAGRFDRTVTTLANTLRSRMTVYLNALLYTRNLFDVKPDLTGEDFSGFVSGMRLQEIFPGIQTMGYVERQNLKQAHARLKQLKLPISSLEEGTNPDEIDMVVYYEQLSGSPIDVLGKDLGSSPERKAAMNKARDLGVAVATDRVTPLNPNAATTFAFLVFLPRYQSGADLSSVESRRHALLGFVYAGFRAPSLFGRASDDVRMQNTDLAIRIYDGTGTNLNRLMYSEGDFEDADISLGRIISFKAADHTWTVEVFAPKNYGLAYLRWSPFFVLALGTMLSLAVVGSLLKSDLLASSLKIAREEAEKANEAKSMFLANISHEIRTPLGIIIGFSETALTEDDKEKRNSYLKTILRNGNELVRIIGDVLDLSKIEAKALLIESNSFSLKKLNTDIKETWQNQAVAKEFEFSFIELTPLPEFIESDVTRMKQILINLLSNAFKFTAAGQVQVSVSRESDPKINAGQEYLVYMVDDSGIGIRSENRSKLFKAFSQEDSSITRKFGGSGLGLAISKELAQAMGGDVRVEPNPKGKGSRFIFKTPLVESKRVVRASALDSSDEGILKNKRILVVEDSEDNQVLIELILRKYDVKLTTVNNGREGVDKALAESFDLVLMDIQMPILDGYGAFAELKSRGYNVPVIALTAHAITDEREKALNLGFAAYLTKPIDRAQLVKVSAQFLT